MTGRELDDRNRRSSVMIFCLVLVRASAQKRYIIPIAFKYYIELGGPALPFAYLSWTSVRAKCSAAGVPTANDDFPRSEQLYR